MRLVMCLKYSVCLLATLQLMGCGKLEFSENPLQDLVPKILKPSAQGLEVVSGAAVGQKTVVNGYIINASVGAIRDQLESHTTNGYVIFHGVEGSIQSETITSTQ